MTVYRLAQRQQPQEVLSLQVEETIASIPMRRYQPLFVCFNHCCFLVDRSLCRSYLYQHALISLMAWGPIVPNRLSCAYLQAIPFKGAFIGQLIAQYIQERPFVGSRSNGPMKWSKPCETHIRWVPQQSYARRRSEPTPWCYPVSHLYLRKVLFI